MILPDAQMGSSADAVLHGRTMRLGADWYLCVFPLPTSLPIPIGLAQPGALDLVTWAFRGAGATDAEPACLLIVAPRDESGRSALEGGARIVVATHFRDVTVQCGAARPETAIPPGDLDVVAKAIVSAVLPWMVPALATLFPLLARSVAALAVPGDAPKITMSMEGPRSCTLSGMDVPNYLLMTSGLGTAFARVRKACLSFAQGTTVALDLEPAWGPDVAYSADSAVLIGTGRFTLAHRRADATR